MTGLLILFMLTAMAAGFILGALIFGHEKDGTMYFYTDELDGKEYTFARFNETDIHEIDKKKSITLECKKLPEGFAPDSTTIMKQ